MGAQAQNQTGWNWIMLEYTLPEYHPGCKPWALCRIKKGRRQTDNGSIATSSTSSKRPMDQNHYLLESKKSVKLSSSMFASQPFNSRTYDKPLEMHENLHHTVPQTSLSYYATPQPQFQLQQQVLNQAYYSCGAPDMTRGVTWLNGRQKYLSRCFRRCNNLGFWGSTGSTYKLGPATT